MHPLMCIYKIWSASPWKRCMKFVRFTRSYKSSDPKSMRIAGEEIKLPTRSPRDFKEREEVHTHTTLHEKYTPKRETERERREENQHDRNTMPNFFCG
mmetsp:Transcript_32560/g.37679  ORF Transcript_32560/g.37679 Transcript_32560/m.37679 type:complete len:98 (+) Transcript_32560:26-319(+)